MATILTKKSDTSSSVPLAADLTNAAGGAELAVNTADKRLYSKTSGGSVVELGTNPSLMVLPSATSQPSGSANGVPYLNGSKVLTSGGALTFDGASLRLANAVGTTANGLRLDGGAQVHYWYLSDNVTSAYEIGSSAGQWKWLNSNGEQMRLTSTGLGIGTSSPAYKLQVTNTVASAFASVVSVNTGTAGLLLGDTDSATVGRVEYDNAGNFMALYTNSTEKLRLDSSGNLGLGVTPSASTLPSIQSDYGILIGNIDTNITNNAYYNSGFKFVGTGRASMFQQDSGGFYWYSTGTTSGTAGNAISFTQAMTLDASGTLLVGTTTKQFGEKIGVASASSYTITSTRTGTGYEGHMVFQNANGAVGSIFTNAVTTSFNTSSDYRLKENIQPMTGALAKLAALKPVTYKWKADGSVGEGFIAHELAEVCPAAVTGEKDAVDANGNPQYQGIDVSFLVGTLTAAIQEQQAIIEGMKTRLAALESK